MTAIVRTDGLVKRYDGTLAVAGVDLAVEPGEIFGLVGPNGAGKTTTMRILATLLRPSSGDAEIAGWSVTRNPDQVRRVLGFMPDVFGVYDDMKVWEYLDFFARCYGIPPAGRRRMIGDLLELVDLADKRDAYVQTLSRGMQQRLCLAHALVHDPQVLLLDEPASGLDPRARVELRELLRELRAIGKTIVISSHILPSSRSSARAWPSSTAARSSPRAPSPTSSDVFGSGPSCGSASCGHGDALTAAVEHFTADPDVASATLLDDGTIELAFRGDDEAAAAPPRASHRERSPDRHLRPGRERPRGALPPGDGRRPRTGAPRMSEPTTPPDRADRAGDALAAEDVPAAHVVPVATAVVAPSGWNPIRSVRRTGGGIAAVGVKELRGRMRGRRAFVILTLYLLLLGGFAWMYELILAAKVAVGVGGSAAYASALIGQEIFGGLLMLITLLVVFLAPSFTAGAISLEREKQTLDMLVTTPISSLAIVIGKLLERADLRLHPHRRLHPDHGHRLRLRRRRARRRHPRLPRPDRDGARARVVRAVLLDDRQAHPGRHRRHRLRRPRDDARLGLRPVLLERDGRHLDRRATRSRADQGPRPGGHRLPQPVPRPGRHHLRDADRLRRVVSRYTEIMGGQSGIIFSSDGDPVITQPPAAGQVFVGKGVAVAVPEPAPMAIMATTDQDLTSEPADDVAAFGSSRDQFWPKTVVAWLVASVVMVTLSIQLVSPTRRWRPGRPRRSPRATP